MEEFRIEGYENQFRFKKLFALDILSLQTLVDFNDFEKTKKFYVFIIEHTEVNVGGTWLNVKEQGREVYTPDRIKNDAKAFQDIITKFMDDVLKPVFQKSNE